MSKANTPRHAGNAAPPDPKTMCARIRKYKRYQIPQIADYIGATGDALIGCLRGDHRLPGTQWSMLVGLDKAARAMGAEAILSQLLHWRMHGKDIASEMLQLEERIYGTPWSAHDLENKETTISQWRNKTHIPAPWQFDLLERLYEQELHRLWKSFLKAVLPRTTFVCSRSSGRPKDHRGAARAALERALAKSQQRYVCGSGMQVNLQILLAVFEANDRSEAHVFASFVETPPLVIIIINEKVPADRHPEVLTHEFRGHVLPYLTRSLASDTSPLFPQTATKKHP